MIKAWVHFFGSDNISKDKITEALENCGISTYPIGMGPPSGQGLLFFENMSSKLCDFLKDASRDGLERVLAIATSHSALVNGCAWDLLKVGASDVFVWDHYTDPGKEIKARFDRWGEVDRLVTSPLIRDNLVGQSPPWVFAMRQIVEIAHFTDASILITGETGTGKELAARLVHTLDPRPNKRDLIVLDCTTIVPSLSGSEFFGHERGAFTGAVSSRDGAFALANGGTLFLDEVGELPLDLQAQLLRVTQEQTYKRVGGNTWHKTNFRLICATNKDLFKEVTEGRFRSDLYYRIASWICKLPSLQERPEDIIPLARHFMKQLRLNEDLPGLDEPVREFLQKRKYPGNVRDLRQLVSRIIYRYTGSGPITVGNIPEEERKSVDDRQMDWRDGSFGQAIRNALLSGAGLKEIGRVAEDIAVRLVIADEEGNLQRAAMRLGVTDRALQMRRAARRQDGQLQEVDQEG